MARIKYGSLVSDISGSIGSATFQKSLYGNTLRNKPLPRKSQSPSQIERRGQMMQLHHAWGAMTDAQRKQWNQFLAFNNATIRRDKSILQTGHSFFLQYNFYRQLQGYSIVTVPNYVIVAKTFGNLVLEYDRNTSELNLYPDASGLFTDVWFCIFLSPPINNARAFSKDRLRFIFITPTADTPYVINSEYINIFGAIPPDHSLINFSTVYFGINSIFLSKISIGQLTVHYVN